MDNKERKPNSFSAIGFALLHRNSIMWSVALPANGDVQVVAIATPRTPEPYKNKDIIAKISLKKLLSNSQEPLF